MIGREQEETRFQAAHGELETGKGKLRPAANASAKIPNGAGGGSSGGKSA